MTTIRLLDARRGLNLKCRELFRDEKIADAIYRYICDGIEECEDAEPKRKTGEWVHISDGYIDIYECDCCGNTEDYEYHYCPKCGADMRGEQDG